MTFLIDLIQNGASYIIPMTVLLGVLIFIHELGHFLVAKYFNVKVETFSLGFGPKIFRFQWGETTYCLSAIPFGGYVKMYGDEIGGDVPEDLKDRSFLDKPIPQRIAIALAGPIMNLALTFVLFFILALVGESAVAPQLGDIAENTKAHQAGFRSGDTVVSINGQSIERWEHIDDIISKSPNKELSFVLSRENSEQTVLITPAPGTSDNPLKIGETVGTIDGFGFLSESSLIGVSSPTSSAGKLGLKTGDQIQSVNGKKISTFRDLQTAILAADLESPTIQLNVMRYDITKPQEKPEELKFSWDLSEHKGHIHLNELGWDLSKLGDKTALSDLGIEAPEVFIGFVREESPAFTAGLKVGDQIRQINATPIKSFDDIIKTVSAYTETDGPLNILVRRSGEDLSISVQPQMTELPTAAGNTEKRFTVGISPFRAPHVENITWSSDGLFSGGVWAAEKTWFWTAATFKSFALLLTGEVSPKNLGGFIAIGQMAQKSWSVGLDAFLRIMAIISLNLFILNLLPVPVLDGGHILLFSIEAIQGKPLSLKRLALVQQLGLFLLLFLMGFTLINDISRLMGS